MPPAVCGSKSNGKRGCEETAEWLATARPSRTFCGCSDEVMPRSTHSSAPSSKGRCSISTRARTSAALTISTRWPRNPNPVTSVHAVAPCRMRHLAAGPLCCRIDLSAALTQRPCANPRMSAAKRAPVPIGFVTTITCPGLSPPFRRSMAGSATPWTLNPSDSSAPSELWPPASAHPAARSAAAAPAIICVSSSSTTDSSPNGTVAMASAACGSAPMAHASPSACTAATSPNTYGSSTKARK
mmetsp:Transcript_5127/g.17875  ORF Transcript_5127/g.17875 Transcript_5127/m.17875 type:complete len:242 (-) Transcript_5127:1479-2204(-)